MDADAHTYDADDLTPRVREILAEAVALANAQAGTRLVEFAKRERVTIKEIRRDWPLSFRLHIPDLPPHDLPYTAAELEARDNPDPHIWEVNFGSGLTCRKLATWRFTTDPREPDVWEDGNHEFLYLPAGDVDAYLARLARVVGATTEPLKNAKQIMEMVATPLQISARGWED